MENLHKLYNDLPFLSERIKIEKVEKDDATLHDKTEYLISIRNLKQALNNGLVLKKVHKWIKVNGLNLYKLKPYIDGNTDLGKKAKNSFSKDFLKLMINSAFEKTIENVRKHRDIELVTTERRRNYLVSEPNFHTTKFLTQYLLAIEIKKAKILMNKPVCLGLSIQELSKILMYEFWYDYVKPKYGEKAELCYMDTESFIVYIKTDDIHKDIAEDVETRFDTSNYELECSFIDRPLPKGKNKKIIGLMKDELGGKIMTKCFGLRAKTYSYLIDDGSEDKKAKRTKKCVIKRELIFENCKSCFESTQVENKINHLEKYKIHTNSIQENHKEFIKNNKSILELQQKFKSEWHNVLTEEINKIALSSNGDKRMQSIDSIETYAYGTSKNLVSDKEEIKCNNLIKR